MTTATQTPLRDRLRAAAKWLQEDCARRERSPWPGNPDWIKRDRSTVADLLIAVNDPHEMAAFDAWMNPRLWQYGQWIDDRNLGWLYRLYREGVSDLDAANDFYAQNLAHDDEPERDEPEDE